MAPTPLIGNQILGGIRKEQAGTGRFSLARFYARRLLRKSLLCAWAAVLGALLAVMLVRSTLWNGMTPAELGSGVYYTRIYYASWCRFDELVCGVAVALLKNYHAGAWTRVTSFGNGTLAAGWLLYRLVETPFMKLRDRYLPSNFANSSQLHQTATA